MSTSALPTFLTAEQIADMLQVDERTVLRWAQQDASMPVTRLGRVVRFEREALLRWLARKQSRLARQSPGAASKGKPDAACSLPPCAARASCEDRNVATIGG